MCRTGTLVDAGGVLLLPNPRIIRELLAPFGAIPDDETCRRAHYVRVREMDRLGIVDQHRMDRATARALGVRVDDLDGAVN